MDDGQLSAREFGAAFKGFLEQAATGVPAEESVFARRLREHLGVDPSELEVVTQTFDVADRPNLQVALDAYLEAEGRSAEVVGIAAPYSGLHGASITELIAPTSGGLFGGGGRFGEGPVEYVHVDLGEGRSLMCIDGALALLRDDDGPLALLISSGQENTPRGASIELQATAPERERAERFLADLRADVRRRNVYRGRVISVVHSTSPFR